MSALAFALPARLEAHEPPEARGLERDEVRLLVDRARGRPRARPPRPRPARAARARRPARRQHVGDAARGVPRAPRRRHRARPARLHAAARLPTTGWSSCAATAPRSARGRAGERLALPGGGVATLVRALPRRGAALGRGAAPAGAAERLPRPPRPADPLPPHPRRLAARRLPDGLRHRARQRRDAERRAPVHASASSRRSSRAGSPSPRSCSTPASRRSRRARRRTPSGTASPPRRRGRERRARGAAGA